MGAKKSSEIQYSFVLSAWRHHNTLGLLRHLQQARLKLDILRNLYGCFRDFPVTADFMEVEMACQWI